MKISRFVGASSRDVLRQVREALGPDALIVANRSVPDGVEVLATLEEPPAAAAAPARAVAAIGAPAVPAAEHAAAGLEAAIGALRGTLESRLDGLLWGGAAGPGREPLRAGLFRTLLDIGFSARLARAMLERLPASLDARAAQAWARNELVTHLPVLASEDELLAEGGVYALVGPTGVGKTTTLAKLAARCVAREGREQVAMLTTDNFRIGALEQLQIYGRLMGIPARSVRDLAELRSALAELGARKIVLVDTTGISQRDRKVAAQAALLCGAGRPVRRLLVINAASQGDTLDEVAHAYRHGAGEDVAGCIITKLDEAVRLGPALDTAIRHRLPIHYVSVGQKVPEDLAVARADELVDRAFAAQARTRALYAPSEADMATLWRASGPAAADQAAQRRRHWLAAALSPGDCSRAGAALADALAWFENDPACVQARAAWRRHSGAADAPCPPATPLAAVRSAFAASCDRYLLALHGEAALGGVRSRGASLQAGLMLSDRGAVLGAAECGLHWPADVAAAAGMPSRAGARGAAAVARAAALATGLSGVPLVHLLDATDGPPWHALPAGTAWLARSAGGLRVLHDDCPVTLNAVGKMLGYVPAGRLPAANGVLAPPPGQAGAAGEAEIWASGTEVAVPRRGGAPVALRLICARVAEPGRAAPRQLFGLTSLSASEADAATLARWVAWQERARRAFRAMAQAWQALPQEAGAADPAVRVMLAAQLGAACWQLAHAPAALAMEAPLRGALAQGRRLTAGKLPAAVLRLFAMLEMAA